MNSVNLIGNLGADPESFFTDDGTQIVNFSLAFMSTKKDKTNWIRVVCFQKAAELAEKYLHKGARIAVNARLDQNKWVDDNNQTKSMIRLVANQITFIKTDGRGFENAEGQSQNPEEATPQMEDVPPGMDNVPPGMDDTPF